MQDSESSYFEYRRNNYPPFPINPTTNLNENNPVNSHFCYDTKGNSYGWGNNEAQWYLVAKKENTFVSKGTLKIIARNEPTSGKKYSSG